MNIFCLLSNYCFLVVLGDGVQFEILHFQMNFFSIPRILTAVRVLTMKKNFIRNPENQNWEFEAEIWYIAPQCRYEKSTMFIHPIFSRKPAIPGPIFY